MKTSLAISDHIFARIRKLAQLRGTTVKALVEEGLRLVLTEQGKKTPCSPKLLTFGGDGLSEEFKARGLSWENLRDEVYKGHGS